MKKILYLHRNDLRFHDNPVLEAIYKEQCEFLPVYIFDEDDYKQFVLSGVNRAGKFKRKFVFDSVLQLSRQYSKHGSTLVWEHGSTQEIVSEIIRNYGITDVYMVKEHTHYEVVREKELVETNPSVRFNFIEDRTMIHTDDLPFQLSEIPSLFTHFRKAIEKDLSIRELCSEIKSLPITITVESDAHISLDEVKNLLKIDDNLELRFKGGENEGLKRLHYYLDETRYLSKYKETRNGLLGDDYSSKFSPWLAVGALSPRKVYWAVKEYEEKYGANESTYWLIFELLWRDFFRFMTMKHGKRIFLLQGIQETKAVVKFNRDKIQFEKWCTGETGQPFIDANMRELNATGFMSNRGRQNVASWLVHDLGLDWRLGAEYFESLLLDYDPCSNWGNWMYLAGVGNDGRENRRFNPERQASMYDSQGEYQRRWLAGNGNADTRR